MKKIIITMAVTILFASSANCFAAVLDSPPIAIEPADSFQLDAPPFPSEPPACQETASYKLKITSPIANQDISGSSVLAVKWEGNLPNDATYSLLYSMDGVNFNKCIISGLKDNKYAWQVDSGGRLVGWIKVKAYSSSGKMLAQDVVPVSYVPPTSIVVSKADQKVFFFSQGKLRNVFTCSTALPQYDLAHGRYKVYSREIKHWSRKYEVWMPHTLFFHNGYALHATTMVHQLGRPASHGCVRLHPRDAKTLLFSS